MEIPAPPESWPIICRWLERREEPPAIARRMERMLGHLGRVSPALGKFVVQLSDKPPGREAPFTAELFERLELGPVSDIDDLGRSLGYSALLYSESPAGHDDTIRGLAELSVHAGGHAFGGRPISSPNNCIIRLPPNPPFDELQSASGLAAIMRCVIEAWEPDYGFVTSSQLHSKRWRSLPKRVPTIGWLTYFPARRGPLPSFDPPAFVVPLGESGAIVVACPERVTVEEAETIAAVDAVEARLREAGLLYPEPDHDTPARTIAELGNFLSTR